MARKKTPKFRVNVKAVLSNRLREIRQELYGEHGGPELARCLDLPARTWYNYETGVTVPAEILLAFIDQTGTNPMWLLSGEGPKYRRGLEDQVLAHLSPEQLIRRGLEKLEQKPAEIRLIAPANLPEEQLSEFVAVGLVPAEELDRPGAAGRRDDVVLAYRRWIPHPLQTVATRLDDDAMHPILPAGSIAAIDRTQTDPRPLQGRIVAARAEDRVVIRWLEMSGRHAILRPSRPSAEHPMLALEVPVGEPGPVIGRVVWSWTRFDGA